MSDIIAAPTAGKRYRVVAGDRLDNIEKAAYGYVTGRLEAANPYLSTRELSLENRPIIYVGDVLLIPEIADIKKLKTEAEIAQLIGKDNDKITIIIDGLEVEYDSCRIIKAMDTAAHACVFRIVWTPGEIPELDRRLIPYSYPEAQVFIGKQLMINGLLYGTAPEQSKEGLIMNLEIYSYAADIIDSTVPTPYTADNITLEDRAAQMLQPIGISAQFTDPSGGAFDRVTGDITDTIFRHLSELASQRGFLISSTNEGNIIFQKTAVGAPVGVLESGQPFPIGWGANFDGRMLFNTLTAIGESPGNSVKEARVVDNNVPRSRFLTFKADETIDGNIETAASWRRSKQFADALTIPFPVSPQLGFYAPDGQLWRENTLVTIVAPEIFVNEGFNFLIKQVEFVSENSGQTTTLSIVPPQVYSGQRVVFPWEAIA